MKANKARANRKLPIKENEIYIEGSRQHSLCDFTDEEKQELNDPLHILFSRDNPMKDNFDQHITTHVRRNRIQSMDSTGDAKNRTSLSETLVGAIAMVLKSSGTMTEGEIVQKVEPVFNMLKKDNSKLSIVNDLRKQVEKCLSSQKEKLFAYNEKTRKWSLSESQNLNNYFSILEKKIVKSKNKKTSILECNRLRKRKYNEYSDITNKLICCLRLIGKNPKLSKIIRKNPFKKIKKIKLNSNPEKNSNMDEELLSEMLTLNNTINEERFIGIMQSFFYFLPLLKDAQKPQTTFSNKFAQLMREMMGEARLKIN